MGSSRYAFNANVVRLVISSVIGLSCALCLVVPSGYSYGFALVLLSSIPLLLWRRPTVLLSTEDFLLLGSFLIYFVVYAIGSAMHNLPLRSYEGPSRFLFSIFIFQVLIAYPPRAAFWWAGVGFGAIAGSFLAFWQVYAQHFSRAQGFMNAVQFGDLCMLLGALSLAGVIWAYKGKQSTRWVVFLISAATMGLVGSLLSGTRGGWPALLLLVLYFFYINQFKRATFFRTMSVVFLLFSCLYFTPQLGMQPRINDAVSDIKQYMDGSKVNTPVGTRLEMWRVSTILISRRPFFGWGDTAYILPMMKLITDEHLRYEVSQLDHVHNDLLDALIKRGIIGLFALLLVYFLPVILFWKKSREYSSDGSIQAFAVAGVMLVLCTFIFGLSQTFFIHNSGVTIYTFYIVVIWTYLRAACLNCNVEPTTG